MNVFPCIRLPWGWWLAGQKGSTVLCHICHIVATDWAQTLTQTICWYWEIQNMYTDYVWELNRGMLYMWTTYCGRLGDRERKWDCNNSGYNCRQLQVCVLPGLPTGWYMCWFPVCTNKQTNITTKHWVTHNQKLHRKLKLHRQKPSAGSETFRESNLIFLSHDTASQFILIKHIVVSSCGALHVFSGMCGLCFLCCAKVFCLAALGWQKMGFLC